MELNKILDNYPLRVSITDFCNLNCFFCSNEGMALEHKNLNNINLAHFKYLVDTLFSAGLKNISLTGGDPTLHPSIKEIIQFLNQYKFNDFFFHTNGISLNKEIVDLLVGNCNKIAVSIHTVNFDTWTILTGGRESQYNKLMQNLEYLRIIRMKNKNLIVELKLVPLKNVNDSDEEMWEYLEFCSKNEFKFKFLNFEPIIPEQIKFAIPIEYIDQKLMCLGCKQVVVKTFRGQKEYIPFKKYIFKNTYGVAIEIGCGDHRVCKECYKSNEIFLTPDLNIKPCHASDYVINLKKHIINKDNNKIFEALVASREFLSNSPGIGVITWQNNY